MKKCYDCRQCNRKGKPSVMRGSSYCNNHIIGIIKLSIFSRIKDIFFNKRFDDKNKKLNTKDFRESWFK